MTTLRPDDVIAAPGGSGLRTATGYTGDDGGWNAAVLGASSFGGAKVLLGYVYRTGSELENAAGVPPDPRDYVSQSVLAKVEYAEAPGGPLTVDGGGRRPATGHVRGCVRRTAGHAVREHGAAWRRRLWEPFQRRRGPAARPVGLVRQRDVAGVLAGHRHHQKTVEQRSAVPPRTPPVSIDRTFRYDDRTLGAEFTAVRAMSSGAWNHELTYGFEYAWTRLEEHEKRRADEPRDRRDDEDDSRRDFSGA